MKKFFKASAGLIAISGAVSACLFVNPMGDGFLPHWVLLIGAILGFLILLSAEYAPKPMQKERGFGAFLVGLPLLSLLVQFQYLADQFQIFAIFKHDLTVLLALHVFLIIAGNYITTAKSLISGLPTFWNMRSDLSWRKSHRFLGFGIVFIAIISVANLIVTGQHNHNFLGVGCILLFVVFNFYSCWLWHKDPHKQALHGAVESDIV